MLIFRRSNSSVSQYQRLSVSGQRVLGVNLIHNAFQQTILPMGLGQIQPFSDHISADFARFRTGGSQNQPMDQLRMIDRNVLRNHASHGGSEHICPLEVQCRHRLRRLLGNFPDGASCAQHFRPVEEVYGILPGKNTMGFLDCFPKTQHAVDGKPRDNNIILFTVSKSDVFHHMLSPVARLLPFIYLSPSYCRY